MFGFGVMLLGLAPFGQEFGLGTFHSLLAQPIRAAPNLENQKSWSDLPQLAVLVLSHLRWLTPN